MVFHRNNAGISAAIFGALLFWVPTIALSQDSPVIGTWKLKSFVREVSGTNERYNQLGDHPNGYVGYSRDGRMYAILVAGDRATPQVDARTDVERLALYKTMIAYGGTYTVDNEKVVHRVDISWNGAYTGTEQVRFYKLDGDTLTLRTAPNKSPIDGREGVGVLVFERVK
jgi:Lipocalin-like domain